jgi:hypothetical protein
MPQVQNDYFCGGCIDRVENQHGHRTTDNTRTSASSMTCPANGNSSSSLVRRSIRSTTVVAAERLGSKNVGEKIVDLGKRGLGAANLHAR